MVKRRKKSNIKIVTKKEFGLGCDECPFHKQKSSIVLPRAQANSGRCVLLHSSTDAVRQCPIPKTKRKRYV